MIASQFYGLIVFNSQLLGWWREYSCRQSQTGKHLLSVEPVQSAQKLQLLRMPRKRGNVCKVDADGVKHGAVGKVGKLKQGRKQASITGFLRAQREPLGEIGNLKEEQNMVDDAPKKENVKMEKIIEKKQVEEKEDPGMAGLCEYEKIRLRNIRQREALFAELALQVPFLLRENML